MVLLIGNYSADRQQSMQRFSALMRHGLLGKQVKVELISPKPFFGKISAPPLIAKWLGYIDKFLLFPFSLRRKLALSPAVVHICDHSNAVYVSQCRNRPVVVTCHDLLAVRGGLGEETDTPASMTGQILQRWILSGLRKADVVICDSRATADDADRLVSRGNPEPQIGVVPLSLNYNYKPLTPAEVRARLSTIPDFDPDCSFALHVGSSVRRKNRDGVLRIFARCKDQWNGRMVFAGDLLDDEMQALARDLKISERIVQIHNPSCEILEALYNASVALIYPSRFEGFGWPIIEAQACGCPVICSNTGPMPEAAGDAGLYHEPEDEAGFARELVRLTNPEEHARWSKASLLNAQRFSTDKMISGYLDVYRSLGVNP